LSEETQDPQQSEPPAGERERRVGKLEALRAAGIEPYPVRFDPTASLAEIRGQYGSLEAGVSTGVVVSAAGRLVARRGHGKLVFAVLREGDAEMQIMASEDVLGEQGLAAFGDLDLGDWVGVRGEVVSSRRGELSIKAERAQLIGKSLRPLPDKWHGLRDVEVRYRQRHVDLTVNPAARHVLAVRSAVVRALREHLEARGFIEVETPMLQRMAGGAAARPFVTHHNALDMDLYLRIAPELYLKRLIAGGMGRVYELNRTFRNEGISVRHNPEFTMLEAYQAYTDYHGMLELTQGLVRAAALAACGTLSITYQGEEMDLSADFRKVTMLESVTEATGVGFDYAMPLEEARRRCEALEVPFDACFGVGKLVVEVFEKYVESNLVQPTFVLDYPIEVSPLARRHRSDPYVAERFELIVAGRELANAFSELVDPLDQRERFEAQARAKAAGDEEAMSVDEDYLAALEFGMPPCGGLGIGVDRLAMLLADVPSIRDVILFPLLRPEGSGDPAAPQD